VIQAGLLGFWGEFWHSLGDQYLPASLKENVVTWYDTSFSKTIIQFRYPMSSVYAAKFGYHDDSFAKQTLGYPQYNGGVTQNFYTWNRITDSGQTDFWRWAPFGGEISPDMQGRIFRSDYPSNTFENQNLMDTVRVTHATYLFCHAA
jgi:hypothetical protein